MSFVNAEHVHMELDALGCPQGTLAALADLSDAAVSKWLRGLCPLTSAAQFRISEALNALQQLTFASAAPIDFRNATKLRAAIQCFRVRLSEQDAARMQREIEGRGEAATGGDTSER